MRRATFRCDVAGPRVPLEHVWEHTIGSGHATLALRADWREQLRRCHAELGVKRVRFHGLLSDDVGTLVATSGGPLYSFFNAERIWDFLVETGMQPFVELSFMPRALASGTATVFHYAANVTPPKRLTGWAELIQRLATHAVDRYGARETRAWNFEVWNEPNLRSFWRGSQSEYFKLYATTARALKNVDPDLRVGGPATSENAWLDEFIGFCSRSKAPVDFISTHYYPTDPTKDVSPSSNEQLAAARRGILRERASEARRRVGRRPLFYTEWNTSSNERDALHDEPYAAAFVVTTLLEVASIVDAYSFWTFSDIFEESYFPSLPFHGGFGLLTLHGVAKPAYRAFQLLHSFGTQLIVPVDGVHPTVGCWIGTDGSRINAMLANHALPGHAIDPVTVEVRLDSVANAGRAVLTRIDDEHGNAKRAWLDMGAPEYPSPRQIEDLHHASALSATPLQTTRAGGGISFAVTVPAHGVAMVSVA